MADQPAALEMNKISLVNDQLSTPVESMIRPLTVNDRRTAIRTLAGKLFTVETSCGKFKYIQPVHYERMSDHLLKNVCNLYNAGKFGPDGAKMYFIGDHIVYTFIDRYLQYGIKINMVTLCSTLGISAQDALKMIDDWGFGDDICV